MTDGEILTQGPANLLPISESLDPSLLRVQGSQPWRESFDRAMGLGLGFGSGAIHGWHGTPHAFEQFSNEAIGTGQGAQSYGYGHYIAGQRATGEHYQQILAGSPRWIYNDPEIGTATIQEHLNGLNWEKSLPGAQWSTEDLAKYNALKQFDTWVPPDVDLRGEKLRDFYMNHRSMGDSAKDWLSANQQRISRDVPGHLLEVHVHPEEHELLDWEQPNTVDITKKLDMLYQSKFNMHAPSIETFDLYDDLAKRLGSAEAASKALHEVGIPGIKYLDEGSRGLPPEHPDATHNYVIFDASSLSIRSRDGIKMTPVEGDPFAPAR